MSEPKEPLIPPDHLIQEWESEWRHACPGKFLPCELYRFLCLKAAQWGADQELGACCDWLEDVVCDDPQDTAKELLAARRPKPPSLKEQAKIELANLVDDLRRHGLGYSSNTIRRALEALPNE